MFFDKHWSTFLLVTPVIHVLRHFRFWPYKCLTKGLACCYHRHVVAIVNQLEISDGYRYMHYNMYEVMLYIYKCNVLSRDCIYIYVCIFIA